MNQLIDQSQEIINQALTNYKPYATILMLSGGHDSLLAYHVAKSLNVPLTHILHGITGTGIQETANFARKVAEDSGLTYLEANAGDAYERYILRKGFFGIGETAHSYAYHVLKREHFGKTISKYIRRGQRGRQILLINGARIQESTRRKQLLNQPIRQDTNNIWVNIVHYWGALERNDFLSEYPHNPVYEILHRSGECLCGTTQRPFEETRKEVSYWFPPWGQWLNDLEKEACNRGFCWKWGEDLPNYLKVQKKQQKQINQGQLTMGEEWLPMCQTCIANMEEVK